MGELTGSDDTGEMTGMRVSIIGAGRNRSGIGEFIGKYFHKNGAEVTSVLGTTEETSKRASAALGKYGIRCVPYTDFDRMIAHERPEAAVIASPAPTHYDYLVRCVEAGLHILCEKPFIWGHPEDSGRGLETFFRKAGERQLAVAMNSQWPFALREYEALCGTVEPGRASRFFMRLSPLPIGREMIPDSVPHALSLLYAAFGRGEMSDLHIEAPSAGEMTLTFKYVSRANDCAALIRLVAAKEQPREFGFGFNGKRVTRSLDLSAYDIYLQHGEERRRIADPLELSVKDFMRAVREKGQPLVGTPHILNNMTLLREIYRGCEEI